MNLVWLRNDLRMDDNPALFHACQTRQNTQVVYIASPLQWQQHHESAVKIAFWQQSLRCLQKDLAASAISLSVIKAETYDAVPRLLGRFCQQNNITDLWYNREYAFNECKRDAAVEAEMKGLDIQCHDYQADLLRAGEPLNQQGHAYRVFTPWYRSWIKQLDPAELKPLEIPVVTAKPIKAAHNRIELIDNASFREDLFPAGEKAARSRLQSFIQHRLESYNDLRDRPSINATSTLSPYLGSGIISARRCAYEIQQFCQLNGSDWRDDPWLRQLGWREFYRYLMIQFPRLCRDRAFKPETENIEWQNDRGQIAAWQQGMTGFPIIDAGMRQLSRTGWMHNRLRMLCASFFTKLMLSDWRQGEQFFMQSLIDGDFANNNGGWQWSASTGCDASPWFRIFNPVKQSQKFDPDGEFIRKMVPELKNMDNKSIHQPDRQQCEDSDYPLRILDYSSARQRVLDRFRKLQPS